MFLPIYEELTIEKMLEFFKVYEDTWNYLPPQPELSRVPRQFIIEVGLNVIGEPFELWVK